MLEEVDRHYLHSGLSYHDCDENFGVVEKAKRRQIADISLPTGRSNLIAKSSKHFIVNELYKVEDFIDVTSLEGR